MKTKSCSTRVLTDASTSSCDAPFSRVFPVPSQTLHVLNSVVRDRQPALTSPDTMFSALASPSLSWTRNEPVRSGKLILGNQQSWPREIFDTQVQVKTIRVVEDSETLGDGCDIRAESPASRNFQLSSFPTDTNFHSSFPTDTGQEIIKKSSTYVLKTKKNALIHDGLSTLKTPSPNHPH